MGQTQSLIQGSKHRKAQFLGSARLAFVVIDHHDKRWPIRSDAQDSLLPLANASVTNVARRSSKRIWRRVLLSSNNSARATPASFKQSLNVSAARLASTPANTKAFAENALGLERG